MLGLMYHCHWSKWFIILSLTLCFSKRSVTTECCEQRRCSGSACPHRHVVGPTASALATCTHLCTAGGAQDAWGPSKGCWDLAQPAGVFGAGVQSAAVVLGRPWNRRQHLHPEQELPRLRLYVSCVSPKISSKTLESIVQKLLQHCKVNTVLVIKTEIKLKGCHIE